jgi:2-polyprenyl-6-hydroxyphenyl methylase / 3-demethylubiquinone-9 3-methyltransferase
LMADASLQYVHVGVDVVASALAHAQSHGVQTIRADAAFIPVGSCMASVVVAGEILEHVTSVEDVVAEVCRILRPGGTVVIDTINDSRLAKFAMVTVAERLRWTASWHPRSELVRRP